MEQPIILHSALYVLKLEDNKYYVGMSYDLNRRFGQHWGGQGAKWTRLHKPVSVEQIIYPATEPGIENRVALEYMRKYGWENVRGGSWSALTLSEPVALRSGYK